jgi:chitodextrinase
MVNVTTAGTYTFSARVATISAGQTFHVEIDGVNVTGSVAVPVNQTVWDTSWATVSVSNITLTAGAHMMRFVMDTNNYVDVNNFTWTFVPPADTQPPTAPANLTATAVSTSQINLSWSPSTDNVGVTQYDVYRNGSYISQTSGATTFSDTGLTPQTTYTYKVLAIDAVRNISSFSNSASATTLPVLTWKVGARVQTNTNANVRSKGSTSGKILCTQSSGKKGTIIGGPTVANSYTWWNVNFDSSCDGWVIQNNLTTKLAATNGMSTLASVYDASNLTQPLTPGMQAPAVTTLQKILNQDSSTMVATTGAGSPGQESDYFGKATVVAVQKFQEKWGIVTAGSPATSGFGAVGPKTLQKLKEVMGL